jgi:curved DNA-binding protein CbpA
MGTLYQVLGLSRGANQQQVKAAFRSLARRFHPDVNAGDETAVQRFKEVNNAYETLANPEARAAYDRALVRRQKDRRRRLGSLAATATATFMLTAGAVSLAVWWSRHSGAPQSLQSQPPSVESTHTRAQQGMPYGKGGRRAEPRWPLQRRVEPEDRAGPPTRICASVSHSSIPPTCSGSTRGQPMPGQELGPLERVTA